MGDTAQYLSFLSTLKTAFQSSPGRRLWWSGWPALEYLYLTQDLKQMHTDLVQVNYSVASRHNSLSGKLLVKNSTFSTYCPPI